MTSPTYQTVAGLQVPLTLVPRIITAFRGTYPAMTASITDDNEAVREVLKFWVTQMLSTFEATVAQAPGPQAAQDVLNQYTAAGDAARQQAIADADTIVNPPATTGATPA